MKRSFLKYFAVGLLSFKEELIARGRIFGRVGFYLLILFIFSRLWNAITKSGQLGNVGANDLLLYLAITEIVALGVPMIHLKIQEDIRSGDIAYLLGQPISYIGCRWADATGTFLARLPALLLTGAVAVPLLTEKGYNVGTTLFVAIVPIICSGIVLIVYLVGIGITAFWIQDCSPFYWIWQKALFVFGGLMIPLFLYPGWLASIAAYTPFHSMIFNVGRIAFDTSPTAIFRTLALLLVWGVIGFGTTLFVSRRAFRALTINGG
jgi:ABC-2 type transport system permease protein